MAGNEIRRTLFDTERVTIFSDTIFAFSITLLALNITVPPHLTPPELLGQLHALLPDLLDYAISFLLVGLYWLTHHRIFHYIKRVDTSLLVLNLLFLLGITFIPFLTTLQVNYRDIRIAVVTFAASMAVTGTVLGVIWLYATHGYRFVEQTLDAHTREYVAILTFAIPIAFLISIGIAFINVRAAHYSWLIFLALSLLSRLHYQHRRNG